ncbi:MAG: hypothetical protein A3B91_02210 [Candidatus Yanofskybacteria bacterium RIFCSPHIGHO2_02_FULL_41_29]|uniref:DUF5667 domain-containing protein n=1 Tax=Candidatus Yanofskybacteria bacterium RIFCSPHIGHO2_01_FULL_41_53 TaxID=1802663 RepID=A0A1F8EG30_9BACT|nr:MAG: hypothetical protein A2650_04915 [Candidatus Yanofskybacteria bacterium RIFCSPHIGHO2_01_FULL_41_53]OGN12339.1 MAG: hypothetical protein A3B91_02210 [Candidatus Yanofskybacteria bacterium RIFCSPHIGHO2_02_FULL_41_29]OGN17702.1 MAG: hypothetical protein A3F48_00485 [Candidatus Yanofskybacteria bacterium RIFCSPHIGHO2_12_FULL_41_9]OGN22008.1 MAG: hypothetical protein A2916_04255 [Candidatus Yanofskybacteria bacterium RIFCSPLOWO2_01_FULL_41_67]OGN28898.1 MAG: hypothetical protein A3H54_02015 
MTNKIEQFIKSAKQFKLLNRERADIKDQVFNFIKNNPVRSEVKPHLNYGSNVFFIPILSKYMTWLSRSIDRGFAILKVSEQNRGSSIGLKPIGTKFSFSSVMAVLLIISVLVGGGVAVGAERALPGDILYPIKVDVTEEVRGWMSVSEEAKADWELRRVQRRLEEAEEMASEGSLDADAGARIEANFDDHAQRVMARVEKFKNKENFNAAASVSLNFETALKAHEKILSRLAETRGDVEVQVKPIRARIKSEVRRSVEERRQLKLKIESGDNLSDIK